MFKFSFTILISISLFLMTSCNSSSPNEQSDEVGLDTIDSVGQVPDSLTSFTASSEQLKGVTVEQRDLNEIFKSISSKELTKEEQEVLIKEYQNSIKLHTPSEE